MCGGAFAKIILALFAKGFEISRYSQGDLGKMLYPFIPRDEKHFQIEWK
jgi:hypothetical protein